MELETCRTSCRAEGRLVPPVQPDQSRLVALSTQLLPQALAARLSQLHQSCPEFPWLPSSRSGLVVRLRPARLAARSARSRPVAPSRSTQLDFDLEFESLDHWPRSLRRSSRCR